MKILYIIDKANFFGSERHVKDLIDFFDLKYSVSLLSFSDGLLIRKLNEIPNYIINTTWLRIPLNVNRILKLIKSERPDVIHAHQPKALLIGVIVGFLTRVPVVITIHSTAKDLSFVHNNIITRHLVYLFHLLTHSISCFLSSKIIFVNKFMYEGSWYKYKAAYIPNWLAPDFDIKLKPKILQGQKSIKFLCVGSHTLAKGFDHLLSFCKCIEKKGFDYCLDIYGGEKSSLPPSLAAEYSEFLNVNFKGYADSISDVYEHYDVFVSFTRYETFGLTFLEAMSQGLPIICLRLETLVDLIPAGNLIVTSPKEACHSIEDFLEPNRFSINSTLNIERSRLFHRNCQFELIDSLYGEVVNC